jgi:nuclear protein localization family protein 4
MILQSTGERLPKRPRQPEEEEEEDAVVVGGGNGAGRRSQLGDDGASSSSAAASSSSYPNGDDAREPLAKRFAAVRLNGSGPRRDDDPA